MATDKHQSIGPEDKTPVVPDPFQAAITSAVETYFMNRKEDTDVRNMPRAVKSTESTVDQLLAEMRDERDRAKHRRKTVAWIVGLVATVIGSFSGWRFVVHPPEEEETVQPSDVKTTVEREGKALEHRVQTVETKVHRLGEIAVDQQIQTVDGIEYISNKIDAAHPDKRGAVPQPETMREARKRADAVKKKRRKERLDPFQDIDIPVGTGGAGD